MNVTKTKVAPDRPDIIALPPVLFLGAMGIGLVLQFLWPVHPFPRFAATVAGAILVFMALTIAFWAETVMRRAGTNVLPTRPALALVTNGPFRFTRNPLYLASALLYLGVTLLFDALWPLILLVPLLVVIQRGVIEREETYLERKFGEPYRAYKARVRRWV